MKAMQHKCNTDRGGQAMGEELRYVQMSRRSKQVGEGREQN